jgi:cytidine deaminase
MLVIVADEQENSISEMKVSDMLPGAFTPKDLK